MSCIHVNPTVLSDRRETTVGKPKKVAKPTPKFEVVVRTGKPIKGPPKRVPSGYAPGRPTNAERIRRAAERAALQTEEEKAVASEGGGLKAALMGPVDATNVPAPSAAALAKLPTYIPKHKWNKDRPKTAREALDRMPPVDEETGEGKWITTTALMAVLCVSRQSIIYFIGQGRLTPLKADGVRGRGWVYNRNEIIEFIKTRFVPRPKGVAPA